MQLSVIFDANEKFLICIVFLKIKSAEKGIVKGSFFELLIDTKEISSFWVKFCVNIHLHTSNIYVCWTGYEYSINAHK